ncbi:MAG: hypothetical protein ABFC63_01995 [Thermoguttaceae bacterium]
MAGPIQGTLPSTLGAAVVGQAAPAANPESADRQVADLLTRARAAMNEGDLDAAESLISKAESLGVQYGPFHLGDTPKKARHDLERKRNAAAAAPAKPSRLFSPATSDKSRKTGATDPFAARDAANRPATAELRPLPQVNGPAAAQSSMDHTYPTTQPGQGDVRTPGSLPGNDSPINAPTPPANAASLANASPLKTARLALAVGDVRRAEDFIARARAMHVNYRPTDDTPERVEAAVRQCKDLAGLDKTTEAYSRMYARSLMEQADGLARWGEYSEAERLAERAAGIRIVYGPFEQKPQELLGRISAARRQAGAPGAAPTATRPADAMPQRAIELVRQARDAINVGQLDRAEGLALAADRLQLPDAAYAGGDRPALVLLDIRELRNRGNGVTLASGQSTGTDRNANRAYYDANNDPTHNTPVASQQPANRANPWLAQNQDPYPTPEQTPTPPPEPRSGATAARTPGMSLFLQGEEALKARDTNRALEFFRQAAKYPNDLDPVSARRLQDYLQMLSGPARTQPGAPPTMADDAMARQQVLARQVASDLAHRESNARAMRETDPKGALTVLEDAKKRVEQSGLDPTIRDQLLRRVDRAIADTKQVIEQNRPQIELNEKNNQVRSDVERRQKVKLEVQEKFALMVNDCNKLMEEERYPEAMAKAKQAYDLDPNNPVATQLLWQTKFVANWQRAKSIRDRKEQAFVDTMDNVEEASLPFDDRTPYVHGDAKDWEKLSARRQKFAHDGRRARSEREVEIEKKLRTPVAPQFNNAPLSKVMEYMAKLGGVNLYLDPQGLAEEGVTTDTPITIDLRQEIMLKSALNLILQPLHLSYVIKDEVLKITSEQMRDVHVYTVTYYVGDLVQPIPNFMPGNSGLGKAYENAMGSVGFGGAAPFGSSTSSPMTVARDSKSLTAATDPNVLAQLAGASHAGAASASKLLPAAGGPGGVGGGTQPDFDSLIDLIKQTVKPSSWDDVGGAGSIANFENNLTLVVSQTQEVHDEIADLLDQLRRLQDLQVTIEVRFITLNDNFFEKIGVNFDFAINDNIDSANYSTFQLQSTSALTSTATGQGYSRNFANADTSRTVTVGLSSPTTFSSDLDIPFTQSSYSLAVPQFGGYDATAGAQLGFAILSDIEAYFFISAAQGDKRSNVLQAPKVTLFNGQQATVADTSQSPFVISVVPVVGDFAAAQQPVIIVLNEGTQMTVQAVVSRDRRFVRLTVVPYFSKIDSVSTFTFTGSTTTTTESTRSGLFAAATASNKLWNDKSDTSTSTSTGTTVQLPTFSYVTVTTTVSVPDGGTVLLGGIKRLSEGRNEYGVPLLNKLPYINRLFQNTAIGRETQSLMMMVTPRIIIQEEEEEKMGIQQ